MFVHNLNQKVAIFIMSWQLLATIIGLILAIAALFDRISSDELKQLIASPIHKLKPKVDRDINGYARFFIKNTISRIFSTTVVSFGNISRAAALSISAISVAILLACTVNNISIGVFFEFVLNGDLFDIFFKFTIIMSFIILTDIVSFLQTALFMNLTTKIKSANDIYFMALCDIIVSINIFTFVFPVGVQYALIFSDIKGRDINLYVSIPNIEDFDKEMTSGTLESFHLRADDGWSYSEIYTIFSDSRLAKEVQIQSPVASATIALKAVSPDDAVRKMISALGVKEITKTSPQINLSGSTQEQKHSFFEKMSAYSGHLHVSKFLTLNGYRVLYQTIFSSIHIVQDSFPAVMSIKIIKMNIEDIFIRLKGSYSQVPVRGAGSYYYVCDNLNGFIDMPREFDSCKSAAIIEIGDALKSNYAMINLESPFLDKIPVSIFMLSSLILTFVFYIGLLTTIAGAKFSNITYRLIEKITIFNIEKNPFGVYALGLIFIVLPFGLAIMALERILIN